MAAASECNCAGCRVVVQIKLGDLAWLSAVANAAEIMVSGRYSYEVMDQAISLAQRALDDGASDALRRVDQIILEHHVCTDHSSSSSSG